MAASYAFAVGSVRAREGSLLTRQDMEGLMLAGSDRELASLLRDKGYGDPAGRGGTEELLREETVRLGDYIWSVAPDKSLFDAFLLRNDIHNAKVALKSTLSGRDAQHLLLAPCTLPPKALYTAAEERRFAALPAWLAGAMERAYDVLAHASDAQLADAVLDRAALSAMLDAAGRTGDPLVEDIVVLQVFYADVKIALRAARTDRRSLFLEEALCPCGGMKPEEWIRALRGGEEEFLALLERQNAHGSRGAAEAYRQSPAAFEKWVDDRLMETARRAKSVTLGAAPLVGYLLAKETEIRAVHMLASGIRTGQSADTMRERGRLLYA